MKTLIAFCILFMFSSCVIEKEVHVHNRLEKHKPAKKERKVKRKDINIDSHARHYFFRKHCCKN